MHNGKLVLIEKEKTNKHTFDVFTLKAVQWKPINDVWNFS